MPNQKVKTYCIKCFNEFYYKPVEESDEWCPACLFRYLMKLEEKYGDLKFELEETQDLLGDSEKENQELLDKLEENKHGKQEDGHCDGSHCRCKAKEGTQGNEATTHQ